jgi:YHS domain-containing protein
MADVKDLVSRVNAEFSALGEKHKKAQAEQIHVYQERQQRLQQLGKVFDRLREIWGPRLEVLVKKFGDEVHVTPRFIPSTREAKFEFQSRLARIDLRLSASTDREVTKVILSSDLEIIPVLLKYDAHSEVEFPLDAIDPEAVARWVDDRIVSFVKTYLALHENESYLKDEMVEDPVAHVRFPKFAAGATLERGGKTYYFVGEETCRDFEKQQAAGHK